jgi:thiol-disulfide isomerase/thioredoxin
MAVGVSRADAASAGAEVRFRAIPEPDPAPPPPMRFLDREGREHALPEFAGRGVLINLWATWCGPCIAEMPALDRLQGALGDAGLVVLPLSSDRGGRAAVEAFYGAKRLARLGIWLDPGGAAARALGAAGLPTSVIVGRDGLVRGRVEGALPWDGMEAQAAVRRIAGLVG